ncbi:MAG TPA: hypothetical protein VIY86_08685, partial [Pirellulaceae bacterium]
MSSPNVPSTSRPNIPWGLLLGTWCWFFLVLFSYYCLKPLRDGLGTQFAARMGGLYVGTLLATLIAFIAYSWV